MKMAKPSQWHKKLMWKLNAIIFINQKEKKNVYKMADFGLKTVNGQFHRMQWKYCCIFHTKE